MCTFSLIFLQIVSTLAIQVEVRASLPGCDLEGLLPDALLRILPGIEVRTEGGPGAAGALLLIVRGEGDLLRVRLRGAGGRVLLDRGMPAGSRACDACADAIALIVERRLREIGWRPDAASLPAALAGARLTTTAGSADTGGPRWGIGVEAICELSPSESRLRAGAAGSLRVAFSRLGLVLKAGGFAPSKEPVLDSDRTAGEYDVWSVFFQIGAGACWPAEGPRFCGSVLAGADFLVGNASGEAVSDGGRRFFWSPTVALQARYVQPVLGKKLSVFAGISAVGRLVHGIFEVEGATSNYKPGTFSVRASGGLLGDFF